MKEPILRLQVNSKGYHLYLEGEQGRCASIFLGKKHGPLVEIVLKEVYDLQGNCGLSKVLQ